MELVNKLEVAHCNNHNRESRKRKIVSQFQVFGISRTISSLTHSLNDFKLNGLFRFQRCTLKKTIQNRNWPRNNEFMESIEELDEREGTSANNKKGFEVVYDTKKQVISLVSTSLFLPLIIRSDIRRPNARPRPSMNRYSTKTTMSPTWKKEKPPLLRIVMATRKRKSLFGQSDQFGESLLLVV
jgi:hypothetical protein